MLFFVFRLVHSHRQIYLSEVKLFFEIKLHRDLGCWVEDVAHVFGCRLHANEKYSSDVFCPI